MSSIGFFKYFLFFFYIRLNVCLEAFLLSVLLQENIQSEPVANKLNFTIDRNILFPIHLNKATHWGKKAFILDTKALQATTAPFDLLHILFAI